MRQDNLTQLYPHTCQWQTTGFIPTSIHRNAPNFYSSFKQHQYKLWVLPNIQHWHALINQANSLQALAVKYIRNELRHSMMLEENIQQWDGLMSYHAEVIYFSYKHRSLSTHMILLIHLRLSFKGVEGLSNKLVPSLSPEVNKSEINPLEKTTKHAVLCPEDFPITFHC